MAKTVAQDFKDENINVELLKVGTPFSISKLIEPDAIIIGSPTHYSDVTGEMR